MKATIKMSTTVTIDTNITSLTEIGQLMKDIRGLKGLTVGYLSDRSGLNWNSVNLFEKTPGTISSIERIAEALDVTIHMYISNGNTEPRKVLMSELQTIIVETIDKTRLPQTDLARISGVTVQGIRNFRNSSNPSVRTIQNLLDALDYKLSFEFEVEGLNVAFTGEGENRHLEFIAEDRIEADDSDFAMKIGVALKSLRTTAQLEKAALARKSGVSAQSILIAENRGRGFKNFYKIAEAFGKKLTVFVTDSDNIIESEINDLPKVLNQIRIDRGITEYAFSKMADMTCRSVSVFANSKSSPAKSVERYAEALNVSIDFKLTDSNSEHEVAV